MLFQQNGINPCLTNVFFFGDNMDLEQHGDDFLVCGLTSNLEVLADEFKNTFLKPEHQNEFIFSNVASVLIISGGMSSWIKSM